MATSLKSYPVGTDVTLTVALIDENGDPLAAATSASFTVLDENDVELQAAALVAGFTPGDTEVTLTVPGSLNVLPPAPVDPSGQIGAARPDPRALRVVELLLTTTTGVVPILARYVVAAPQKLTPMVNSFQTYERALLETYNMPKLDGWEQASDQARQAALTEAFFRVTRLGFKIASMRFVDNPPAGAGTAYFNWGPHDSYVISPELWKVLTADDWTRYPLDFRTAVARAQIAEANVILGGDITSDRRRAGLMSETIGDSSNMFRPGKPLELPISPAAAAYLTGYIVWRATLTRS